MRTQTEQKSVVNHFEAGANCQVFNGDISGCTLIMPEAKRQGPEIPDYPDYPDFPERQFMNFPAKKAFFSKKVWSLRYFYLLLPPIIQLITQNLKLYCLSREIYFIIKK